MRTSRWLVGLVCAFLALAPGAEAGPTPTTQLDRMKDLRFLTGTWNGSGWREYTPGQRTEFLHQETAHLKLNGYVLLIEGVGRNQIAGSQETVVTYEGMGVVSFDARKDKYRYSAYEFSGRAGEADEVDLKDGTFTWGFRNVPQVGSLRFRVKLNAEGNWYEYGEMSSDDGKTWRKYFEMTLHKTAA